MAFVPEVKGASAGAAVAKFAIARTRTASSDGSKEQGRITSHTELLIVGWAFANFL